MQNVGITFFSFFIFLPNKKQNFAHKRSVAAAYTAQPREVVPCVLVCCNYLEQYFGRVYKRVYECTDGSSQLLGGEVGSKIIQKHNDIHRIMRFWWVCLGLGFGEAKVRGNIVELFIDYFLRIGSNILQAEWKWKESLPLFCRILLFLVGVFVEFWNRKRWSKLSCESNCELNP